MLGAKTPLKFLEHSLPGSKDVYFGARICSTILESCDGQDNAPHHIRKYICEKLPVNRKI